MFTRFQSLAQAFKRVTLHGRYRPEIDGLRFFAIALVLFGHLMERLERATTHVRPLGSGEALLAFLTPKATTGVLLFFTISGYVLGLQFHRHKQQARPFHYKDYLVRRATRIVPPYYLILLLGAIALGPVGFKPQLMNEGAGVVPLASSFLVSLLFVHGIVFAALPQAFPPGWSLEQEVQFYIVAPFLFMLMMHGTRTDHRGWKFVVLGASVAAMALCTYLFGEYGSYYLSLARNLPFFLLGPLLVMAYADRQPGHAGLADGVGFAGLLALAGSGILQNVATGWVAVTALDVFRLVAIAAVFHGAIVGARFKAMCSVTWLSVLGGACFSLYLCHLQVMQVLTPLLFRAVSGLSLGQGYVIACLVELPMVLLVGMTFYLLVERPFMKGIDWKLPRFLHAGRSRTA